MKKRVTLLSFLLTFCLLLTACGGQNATKAEFFTYIVDVNNHVVITGYVGNEASVIIPSRIDGKTVTQIAEDAFYANKLMVKVVIPDTVTDIGDSAFAYCPSLESVTLPHQLTRLSVCLFNHCSSLKSVDIPKTVTRIGKRAFEECRSLASVTLPDSLQIMGSSAFAGTGISSIVIPAGVRHEAGEEYGFWFSSCAKLRNAEYADGCTEVWLGDFHGSAEKYDESLNLMTLDTLTIPASVNTVYDWIGNDITTKDHDGLCNCTIRKVCVSRGSVAVSVFEAGKKNNRFEYYIVNEKFRSFISGEGYGTGDIYGDYLKHTSFEGIIEYDK